MRKYHTTDLAHVLFLLSKKEEIQKNNDNNNNNGFYHNNNIFEKIWKNNLQSSYNRFFVKK